MNNPYIPLIRTGKGPPTAPTCNVLFQAKGQVQRMGSQEMHGLERSLLEHVVQNAEPGNPDSVAGPAFAAMGGFFGAGHKFLVL